MYIYIYICMYVCMYVCMYIYIYTYMYCNFLNCLSGALVWGRGVPISSVLRGLLHIDLGNGTCSDQPLVDQGESLV